MKGYDLILNRLTSQNNDGKSLAVLLLVREVSNHGDALVALWCHPFQLITFFSLKKMSLCYDSSSFFSIPKTFTFF